MTDDELNEIEARANKATPGRWKHVDMRRHQIICENKYICEDKYIGGIEDYENANFITHAREDVPNLLAEVRQLRAERDAIIKTVSKNSHQNCPGTSFNCKCHKPGEDNCNEENCWLEWARRKAEKAEQT